MEGGREGGETGLPVLAPPVRTLPRSPAASQSFPNILRTFGGTFVGTKLIPAQAFAEQKKVDTNRSIGLVGLRTTGSGAGFAGTVPGEREIPFSVRLRP